MKTPRDGAPHRHANVRAADTVRTMTLADLFGDATLPPVRVRGLALDSRAVKPGDLFVALRGGTSHGMDFATKAVASGAVAVAFEPPADVPESHIPFVAIANLRARLGDVANRFHDAPTRGMTVIGVTGTNGKTSTVQLLAQALTRAGHVVGTIGTLGAGLHGQVREGERTTPDVLAVHGVIAAMARDGATHLAMEVSSHALDQGRVDGIAFDVAVFTNLTRDHLDYHGTLAAYGEAKARLFGWDTLGTAVINADDALGRQLLSKLAAEARGGTRSLHRVAYSANGEPNAEVRATAIVPSLAGLEFRLHTPHGEARIRSSLLGRFNVSNLLAVAGCLSALGWSIESIADAIAELTPIDGRMNRLGGDGTRPLVVVDYAHTPDALEQALTSLRAHADAKLVCVFGCGGDRDRGKRPQMAAIAEAHADVVIVTDDNPRTESGDAIVADIVEGFADRTAIRIERDRGRAIALALSLAQHDDVVLIAGKGHEAYQEVAGVKHAFDDLAVAREALERAA